MCSIKLDTGKIKATHTFTGCSRENRHVHSRDCGREREVRRSDDGSLRAPLRSTPLPMVRHYVFFGQKPPVKEAYNPLQKHAYTSAIALGVLSVLTGLAVWKPVQLSWLAWMMGGFHLARLWHFLIMWAILAFVFGHLVMVILHGWDNFVSMFTGWKKNPEYVSE